MAPVPAQPFSRRGLSPAPGPPPRRLAAGAPYSQCTIFEYIACFCNRVRRHATLGYLSPIALRAAHERSPTFLPPEKTGSPQPHHSPTGTQ
ncbi:IS3 family transposase [Thermogemmatispora sp.]|uniref:IS3 family transposase n=1 Tax=Thermogemmatispora sp. TaxID=1968838 RepID=UPI0035E44A3D